MHQDEQTLSVGEQIEVALSAHFVFMNEVAQRIRSLMDELGDAKRGDIPPEVAAEAGEVWKIRRPNYNSEFTNLARTLAQVTEAAAKIAGQYYEFNKINAEAYGTKKALVGGVDVFAAIEGSDDPEILRNLLAAITELEGETNQPTAPTRYGIAGTSIIDIRNGGVVCDVMGEYDTDGAIQRGVLDFLNRKYA
jgi:hypothetical protein